MKRIQNPLVIVLLTTSVFVCSEESVTSRTINIYDCPGSSWWNDDCDGSKEWWCLQLSRFPPKYAVIASLARSEPRYEAWCRTDTEGDGSKLCTTLFYVSSRTLFEWISDNIELIIRHFLSPLVSQTRGKKLGGTDPCGQQAWASLMSLCMFNW